jgi:hypothetical protein
MKLSAYLLPDSTPNINEDWGLWAGRLGILIGERDDIEPSWEGSKLGFHEPVEGTGLHGVGLEPSIEVRRAVVANLEGGARIRGVR